MLVEYTEARVFTFTAVGPDGKPSKTGEVVVLKPGMNELSSKDWTHFGKLSKDRDKMIEAGTLIVAQAEDAVEDEDGESSTLAKLSPAKAKKAVEVHT